MAIRTKAEIEKRAARKAERERRKAALLLATVEGVRTGVGDETAILCSDCGTPGLVCRPRGQEGPSWCSNCGFHRFVLKKPLTGGTK